MDMPAEKERYTYADYLEWPDDERVELIEGVPVMMAPPQFIHQKVVMELSRQISNYLLDRPCLVLPAPFGVRLFEEAEDEPELIDTVVEPDITVICDRSKIDKQGYKGAPAWIIEVLSPSTGSHDRSVKYKLYERAGVGEYWLVDPESKVVQTFSLEEGLFRTGDYLVGGGTLRSATFPELTIDLDRAFAE